MEFKNWHDVLFLVLMAVILLGGAPVIQLIKNGLAKLIGKPVKDKWALLVAIAVSAGLALLEMFLGGQLAEVKLSLQTFPAFLTAVFSVATVWYKALMA